MADPEIASLSPEEKADRIADCLGLRDGSYVELVPAFVSYAGSVDHLTVEHGFGYRGLPLAFDRVLHQGPTANDDPLPTRPICNVISARHPPALVRAVALLPPFALTSAPWYLVLKLLTPMGDYPLLASFMRTYTHEAQALAIALLAAAVSKIPSTQSFVSDDGEAWAWASLSRFILETLAQLLPSPLGSVRLSDGTGSVAEACKKFYNFALGLHEVARTYELNDFPMSARLKLLASRTIPIAFMIHPELATMPSSLHESVTRTLARAIWHRCEGTRSVVHTCEEPAPGQEMPCCGKCQAVRYCCRAIQKADWKTHKIHCIAPEW